MGVIKGARCLCNLSGDLDFFANDVGLPHWSNPKVCGICLGDRAANNYKHFSRGCGWRNTIMDQASFALRFNNIDNHPVLDYLRTYSYKCWGLDGLHVVDYNGVASHCAGNVLAEIVVNKEFGDSSQEKTLERINHDLVDFYRTHGTPERIGDITLKTLGIDSSSDNFPCLGGPGVKAANTKALIPFIVNLCRRTLDGSKYKARRLLMAESLESYYVVIRTAGVFLTDAEQQQLNQAVYNHLVNYSYLALKCMNQGVVRYNVVVKHHYFAHMPMVAQSCNPKFLHTYAEESFVGCITRIYSASCSGPYKGTVQNNVLKKSLVALQLKLRRMLLSV